MIIENVKCTKCNFTRERDNNHKPGEKLYDWSVAFDNHGNGEVSGFYTSASKENPKFKVGETASIDVNELTSQKGAKYNKIKPYSPKPQGGYNSGAKQNQKGSNAGYALRYAVDLAVAGSAMAASKQQTLDLADDMYNWLNQRS